MAELKYLFSKKPDETYSINWYDGPQIIENNGYKFISEPIKGIVDISTFSDETFGENKDIHFTKYIKFKYGDTWSDLILLEDILSSGLTFSCGFNTNDTNTIDTNKEIIIELYYYVTLETISTSTLSVNNIRIGGEYAMNVTDEEAFLPNTGDEIILASEDIYKIFNLDDFNVVSNHETFVIKYRFTQDDGRTFTPWETLTTENISSIKLNPLRFAKVEYLIKNLNGALMVYDIILEGDFQNVSANYLKTNKYGLKEDCLTGVLGNRESGNAGNAGNLGNSPTNMDFYSTCSTYKSNDIIKNLETENGKNTGDLLNPYQFDKITDFGNMLGNHVSNIFGWNVDYHLTDPDIKGEDKYMHEYTLKNIVDMKSIKVIVPDNKFPIETLIINQFNLDLYDVFEIHIMKDAFKNAFGIQRRPSEDDIVYICDANMLYYVKHAQAFKDIMNAATYYKLILEKYEYRTDIRNLHEESKLQIDELTNNTTIDEILGNDNRDEEKKIANKEQTYPTTFEKVRHKISKFVDIVPEKIIIQNFETLQHYYDLSNTKIKNKTAINYKKSDNELKKGDNRSFVFWFKFNNAYDNDKVPNKKMIDDYYIKGGIEFNFLTNHINNLGYKIHYKGDILFFTINNDKYKLHFDYPNNLLTNIWYQGVINLDQRQQNINISVYNFNTSIVCTLFDENTFKKVEAIYGSNDYNDYITDGYKPINNEYETPIIDDFQLVKGIDIKMEPTEYTHDENLKINGSNIKISNIRIFNNIIPTNQITNILRENIIKDSDYLILADNANKNLTTKTYYNQNFR